MNGTRRFWLRFGVAGAFVLSLVTNPLVTVIVVVLLELLVRVESLL